MSPPHQTTPDGVPYTPLAWCVICGRPGAAGIGLWACHANEDITTVHCGPCWRIYQRRGRPTTPEVLPTAWTVKRYPRSTALHAYLDDGNLDDGTLEAARIDALRASDTAGYWLAGKLLQMTRTQRHKIWKRIQKPLDLNQVETAFVTLETRYGVTVAHVPVPDFIVRPTVIHWNERTFIRSAGLREDLYYEVFGYEIPFRSLRLDSRR